MKLFCHTSKQTVPRISRKRNHVADVGHACNHLHKALEAQAESYGPTREGERCEHRWSVQVLTRALPTCVWDAAKAPQIEIPLQVLANKRSEAFQALFARASSNELSYAGHLQRERKRAPP